MSATAKFTHTNRLINEKSPYLLQHAHNPVDWYPWGEEAFLKAQKENKPIFLSIGYSTCHWCHVMEHESFENEEIAKTLNTFFVSIKVDREERPDLDRVYMTFVQALSGNGGWPMTVWLTPHLEPFSGGTYFPPQDRFGRPGLTSALHKIAEAWQTNPGDITASANNIMQQLRQFAAAHADSDAQFETTLLDTCYQQIKDSYDSRNGGFGDAPKFPRPVSLNFLFRYYARTGVQDALAMCLFTLRKMAGGGIHDHIGGGFHRYSVDDSWHVPHFEKMLYDQAQIACSYLDAYQITRDHFFADAARDVLDYVLRDMTGNDGQFYAAEDADSPLPSNSAVTAEGAFYVWEQSEIVDALGRNTADVFNYYFGVKPEGNVSADPQDEFRGKNILIVRHSLAETATKFGESTAAIESKLSKAQLTLRNIRSSRPRPHLDDKTITSWNGLMISACARAFRVLDEPRYLSAAQKASSFIQAQMSSKSSGNLLRRYRAGEAAINGFADDYAFLIQGLIDLYEASFEIKWLTWALALQKKQNDLFGDNTDGGYFNSDGADSSVLMRMKEDYDNAEPSANSVAALNLLRLSEMTGNTDYRFRAERVISAMSSRLKTAPSAMPQMLVAINFFLDTPKQIVIAGTPGAIDTRDMAREVNSFFMPNSIILLADGGIDQNTLASYNEFIKTVRATDGKATAYICRNYVCNLPTNSLEIMKTILKSK